MMNHYKLSTREEIFSSRCLLLHLLFVKPREDLYLIETVDLV